MNELDLLLDDSMGFDPVEILMQLDELLIEEEEICLDTLKSLYGQSQT